MEMSIDLGPHKVRLNSSNWFAGPCELFQQYNQILSCCSVEHNLETAICMLTKLLCHRYWPRDNTEISWRSQLVVKSTRLISPHWCRISPAWNFKLTIRCTSLLYTSRQFFKFFSSEDLPSDSFIDLLRNLKWQKEHLYIQLIPVKNHDEKQDL